MSHKSNDMKIAEWQEHEIIYLSPACVDCAGGERTWCQDDMGPCEDCGRLWIRYKIEKKRRLKHDKK